MTFRTILSMMAALCFAAPAAFAQDEGHEGHDHAEHSDEGGVTLDTLLINHALTEAPDDHAIGLETAPNTMIIYASVTCPHCADWFTNQWPTFKSTYVDTGNTRVIFREFPTAPAQLAMAGFLVANCGPDEYYFENIEYQMQKQTEIFERVQKGEGQDVYLEIGQKAGLQNETDMQSCFQSEEDYEQIKRAIDRARAAGVDTVPAFFVNEKRYKGDLTAEGFMTRVENLNAGNLTDIPESAVE